MRAIKVAAMASAFGELLKGLLLSQGLTMTAFARAVGTSHSMISQVISGRNTPPPGKWPSWAAALDLKPGTPAYRRFMRLAAIAHMPKTAQDDFVAWLDQQEHVEQQQERMAAELDRLREDNRALRGIVSSLAHAVHSGSQAEMSRVAEEGIRYIAEPTGD